jgi:hypothetical protein
LKTPSGLAFPKVAMDYLNVWFRTIQHVDNPPERPKAPAGTVSVRFIKPYPGSRTFTDRIPPYDEGNVAGFPAAVARRLIKAGFAEVVPDAA